MSQAVSLHVEAPVRTSVDVVVVGSGPSGLSAAISAARRGARTLLVERFGYVGGNLTAGLVGPCMTSYSLDGSTQLIKGVFEELVLRMEADGQAIHPSKVPANSPYCGYITYGHDKVTPFEPEAVKATGLEMLQEAGVEILFHTTVIAPRTDGDQVTGLFISSKSGIEAIDAKVVVDCSADADVVAGAGGETIYGREEDGLAQPMTLFCRVTGVDDAAVDEYVTQAQEFRPFKSIVDEGRRAGEYSIPRMGIGLYKTLRPGVWRLNTTRVLGVSGVDVADLTAAEIEGRKQVHELIAFLRRRAPGFSQATLLDTAAMIGVRETRRIVGDYTLTLADLETGRHFEDVIGTCGYPVDIHSPVDAGGRLEDDPTANIYEMPFRMLVPQTLDGVLVAGRSVSATHEALAAIRVMPPSFAMGQAAGTAAALAVATGVQPRAVDVQALQDQLLEDNAYLGAERVPQTIG
ncbi:FAD-dependent oxidoreductase [Ruania zhangjianzhongii]|uniref:FAD-dependent oxidoreductase n=1 Tax=Ruania zhangjianzhongii TaxID=2603206 RepID=UPI001F331087|nr:FAD-dependent oxidoreductase [Ruania zhangjianzhongii]